MRLAELFDRAGLVCPPDKGNIEITGIATDSRKITAGCLFLCVKGLHTDGHLYMEEAVRAGASVIVAEYMRDVCVGGAAIIMIENTRSASALLYNAWFGNPAEKLKIIGVTGTNGKTSVTCLLCSLLEAAGHRVGVIGTVGSHSAEQRKMDLHSGGRLANMTTPDPDVLYEMLARMVQDGVEYVCMEVTSHALALGKCDAIVFDTAVFTNLTQDHLDFHGNMENYYQAKKKLFGMCRRAVVNLDDPSGVRLCRELPYKIYGCSVGGNADFTACDVRMRGAEGFDFRLRYGAQTLDLSLPLVGEFMIINSLEAAAVALLYGTEPQIIADSLAKAQGAPGRMEAVKLSDTPEDAPDFSVLIDYAHTPDALEKLLSGVRSFHAGRIILLFGCGGDRDRGKRALMAQVACRGADAIILTEDNSRSEPPERILSDILGGMDCRVPFAMIRGRERAIAFAVKELEAGDCLLLAGKGHEQYEINAEGRVPFCEAQIVREAFLRYHKKSKTGE